MKSKKLCLMGLLMCGICLTLSAAPVMAEGTMGDVMNALAASLNMSVADLTNTLYPGGFNGSAPATDQNIASLYVAVSNAINSGQISGNASSLVSGAARSAGVAESVITSGITMGTGALTSTSGTGGGRGGTGGVYTVGGTSGGAGGGGGGGTGTQSR
jgi:hypothetical protein